MAALIVMACMRLIAGMSLQKTVRKHQPVNKMSNILRVDSGK
jgi:hypothetical protein